MKSKKVKKEQCIEQGIRLKKCLKARKMSQKEFAGIVGFTEQYVSNMVNGQGICDENIDTFAEVLQVSRDYLSLKSRYATKDEFMSDLMDQQKLDTASLEFLESFGYTFEDLPGAAPLVQISFTPGASDQEILQKARNAAMEKAEVYRVITPSGKRKQVQRKELLRLLAEVQAFTRSYMELRLGK